MDSALLFSLPGGGELLVIFLIMFLPFFILSIIAVVSALRSKLESNQKIMWVLLSLFVPVVGPILYLAIGMGQARQAKVAEMEREQGYMRQ